MRNNDELCGEEKKKKKIKKRKKTKRRKKKKKKKTRKSDTVANSITQIAPLYPRAIRMIVANNRYEDSI